MIFVNESNLREYDNVRIYLYDFSKPNELENFKKVFQEYMAMYVRNEDIINYYDLSNGISEKLQKEFKKIYKKIHLIEKQNLVGFLGNYLMIII